MRGIRYYHLDDLFTAGFPMHALFSAAGSTMEILTRVPAGPYVWKVLPRDNGLLNYSLTIH